MTDKPTEEKCRFGRTYIADHGWNRIKPCGNLVTGIAPRPDYLTTFSDGWKSDDDFWPACTRHSKERATEIMGAEKVWALERLLGGPTQDMKGS
jgi:hypothetical protein